MDKLRNGLWARNPGEEGELLVIPHGRIAAQQCLPSDSGLPRASKALHKRNQERGVHIWGEMGSTRAPTHVR